MRPRRPSLVAPLLVSMIALLLGGCGREDEKKNLKPGDAPHAAGKPVEAHPAWFVGKWVFDLEGATRRLDALGVPRDAQPGAEAMTHRVLEAWAKSGLEYVVDADGGFSQWAEGLPRPDARYRWRAVAEDEIEFTPTPDNPAAKMGLGTLRLRRVGEGLETYKPRWPIRTAGGEFRYLYRRAPK